MSEMSEAEKKRAEELWHNLMGDEEGMEKDKALIAAALARRYREGIDDFLADFRNLIHGSRLGGAILLAEKVAAWLKEGAK